MKANENQLRGKQMLDEHILNRHEVARRLAVSEQTVGDFRRRGLLAAVQIGRGYRFRPSDIDKFLKANTVNPSESLPEQLPPAPAITPQSKLSTIAYALLTELRCQHRLLAQIAGRRS